ncbi:hypothetical protein [Sulfobacillus harzensis]|uniref:Uncharacterized protein n=1 Tax=Sulfobacillus harzensis TaxID=2729629 RepID=A0A7Y0L4B1_9FIRM|nr:hypothetical protein [Sulfobacillus harzensis]NMP22828.1 hypothetical protein [Sulfobacillus harzensis]
MCIITSRAGSVSIMGLGLVLVGLMAAALIVAGGQLWMSQQALQDALGNAALVMEQAHQTSAAELVQLVEDNDPQASSVTVLFCQETATGTLDATVSAPVTLTFWAPWMGIKPLQVQAQV